MKTKRILFILAVFILVLACVWYFLIYNHTSYAIVTEHGSINVTKQQMIKWKNSKDRDQAFWDLVEQENLEITQPQK